MGRFAVAVVLLAVVGWPLCAHAAPLDKAIQSLNDAAFVSGHAPAAGGVILSRVGDATHPALGAGRLQAMDLTAAMARPLQSPDEDGLRLGGQVQVRTVGAFVQRELKALGVKDGTAEFGGEGRFYLFAAVHGQAVGLNLQTQGGGLHRAGWTTDASSALIGDGQVGIGWRRGEMEADIGYVHRGVHIKNAPVGASDGYSDDMAAVSLTLHPHW